MDGTHFIGLDGAGAGPVIPTAREWPQGTCPKPWVAMINGEALFDARGGLRRFSSHAAALRAAQDAVAKQAQPTTLQEG